ncbi:hypothetical protein SRIMM317S_01380 [Streptomyces rimosus subsp. rimosus]
MISVRVRPESWGSVRPSRKESICQSASRAVVCPVERATWTAIASLSSPASTRPASRRSASTSASVSALTWPMSAKPMARQKREASSMETPALRAAWKGV